MKIRHTIASAPTSLRNSTSADTIRFLGNVRIEEHLSKVHVVVLTSLSEAQPLVLLEAGAAGIPCVTTNVGSCREILLGREDEVPELGAGGIVTDLVAPEQIADAVCALLNDAELRQEMGRTLKARVGASFASEKASTAYRTLYTELIAAPTGGRQMFGRQQNSVTRSQTNSVMPLQGLR